MLGYHRKASSACFAARHMAPSASVPAATPPHRPGGHAPYSFRRKRHQEGGFQFQEQFAAKWMGKLCLSECSVRCPPMKPLVKLGTGPLATGHWDSSGIFRAIYVSLAKCIDMLSYTLMRSNHGIYR